MQHGSVVEIVDLFLALLGQLNIKHVYREVELGLGLFEVLLVKSITSNPSLASNSKTSPITKQELSSFWSLVDFRHLSHGIGWHSTPDFYYTNKKAHEAIFVAQGC